MRKVKTDVLGWGIYPNKRSFLLLTGNIEIPISQKNLKKVLDQRSKIWKTKKNK